MTKDEYDFMIKIKSITKEILDMLRPRICIAYDRATGTVSVVNIERTYNSLFAELARNHPNEPGRNLNIAIKVYNKLADYFVEKLKREGLEMLLSRYKYFSFDSYSKDAIMYDINTFFMKYNWYDEKTKSLVKPILRYIHSYKDDDFKALIDAVLDENKIEVKFVMDDNDGIKLRKDYFNEKKDTPSIHGKSDEYVSLDDCINLLASHMNSKVPEGTPLVLTDKYCRAILVTLQRYQSAKKICDQLRELIDKK